MREADTSPEDSRIAAPFTPRTCITLSRTALFIPRSSSGPHRSVERRSGGHTRERCPVDRRAPDSRSQVPFEVGGAHQRLLAHAHPLLVEVFALVGDGAQRTLEADTRIGEPVLQARELLAARGDAGPQ